ncbi:MAG TPA: Hpt domain-containing protein [Spirochaetota bacterium]|nr:Hpt domain-containing protein [Spirochaetota bacterium]HPS87196.1 Hpt domain-containing protein [Spirochaetota bacterium]
MDSSNILNIPELVERLDGDFELFVELSELFFEDSSSLLNKIEDSIKNSDSEALRKSAHTLKGAVSNFSAQRAYDAAYELEIAGKDKLLENAADKLNTLKNEISEVINAMKSLVIKGSF